MVKKNAMILAALGAILPATAMAAEPAVSFSKLWTYHHASTPAPGQGSEIPAFDPKTNTLWVAGVVGVDVLDATSGKLVQHIDVNGYGFVNSVAIHNGLAAFAIEAPVDRRNPGLVLFYDTRSRTLAEGVSTVSVGALPDMLTFTHDGSKLLVANEGTPNAVADTAYTTPDPAGSVSIIDMETRSVVATPGFAGVATGGSNLRSNTGMDFEPEYIAASKDGNRAFVTLQDANAMAVLDLVSLTFTQVIGLGAKDFSQAGNEIDPLDNDATVSFISAAAKGLYMPDGIAAYKWKGQTYLVMANEGDFREDNVDRSNASSFGAAAPLNRLRVSNSDSSPGNLYAAGARSFSIRDAAGELVYDSGSTLDREAAARGVYDDGRSRDKGVEPEGVALLESAGRTYAFIGLERATQSAVAVFDITNPQDVGFVDMIVTAGDLSPEGLVAYHHRGLDYLAIANEISNTTTLYRLNTLPGRPE